MLAYIIYFSFGCFTVLDHITKTYSQIVLNVLYSKVMSHVKKMCVIKINRMHNSRILYKRI